jgi:hypothetical protein
MYEYDEVSFFFHLSFSFSAPPHSLSYLALVLALGLVLDNDLALDRDLALDVMDEVYDTIDWNIPLGPDDPKRPYPAQWSGNTLKLQ